MPFTTPKIPREEFIQKVVIPYFWGSHEKTNLYIIVFDLLGHIIYCNQSYATLYGCKLANDLYGKTYNDLAQGHDIPTKVIEDLETIRNQVINQQRTIRFIYFANRELSTGAYINYHLPIFYIDGSIIATAVRFSEHVMLSKFHLTNTKLGYTQAMITRLPKVALTERQNEILFLLSISFAQEEIAIILGITRGTVSSCIASLCKKIDISGQNTSGLIEKALKLNLISSIPPSLIKTRVFPIDR